jgi:hypothetical protein
LTCRYLKRHCLEVPVPDDPLLDVPLPEVPPLEVPVPDDPLLEVPLPEVPLLEVPVPDDPLLDVPPPEDPLLEVPLPEVPVPEVPPLEPLWAGTKGMVPPPHPTREITANTKTHVFSIEISFKLGIGTNPLWPDDYGAQFQIAGLRDFCRRSDSIANGQRPPNTVGDAAPSILPRTKTKTTPVLRRRTKGTWLIRNCRGKRLRQGLPSQHQKPG